MTAATYSGVTAFDRGRIAPGDYRWAIRRGAGISLGTLTVAGGTASAVTLTAVWMIAAAMSGAPHLPGLGDTPTRSALNRFDNDFAGTRVTDAASATSRFADRWVFSSSRNAERDRGPRLDAVHRVRFPRERFAFTPADEGEREAAALDARSALPRADATPPSGYVAATFDLFDPEPTLAAAALAPLAAAPMSVATAQTPSARATASNAVSPVRQAAAAHAAAPLMLADAEANPALPPVSDAAPASHSTLTGFLRKLFGRQLASANADVTPALGGRTAIYDIEAGVVYLPDGEKLEAHSGLGGMMDDPHYVSRKDRGPTPPNVYDLVLREGSFHGVQAIRLKPENDDKMFGRAGILAHPYMLGPTGQSFGCVSFKDYPRFLKAFENGEVSRLVVVPSHGDYPRYAAND
jgi:hypothetical protein